MPKVNFVRIGSYNKDLIQIYKKKVKINQKNEAHVEIFTFE